MKTLFFASIEYAKYLQKNKKNAMINEIVKWFEAYFGVTGLLHILFSKLIIDICEIFMSLWIAVLIFAMFGLFKEFVYDKLMKKGMFDKKDLLSDLAGIVLGLI